MNKENKEKEINFDSKYLYCGTLSGVCYDGVRGYLHKKVDHVFEYTIPFLKHPIQYKTTFMKRYCSDREWMRHFGHEKVVGIREKIYRKALRLLTPK